jgi:Kef-type K+ transport system membrane component KefB
LRAAAARTRPSAPDPVVGGRDRGRGSLIGPALLDWVSDDEVVNVFAKLGVALLLFLAGLELNFAKLRGRPLQLALVSFVASLGMGFALALPLGAVGIVVDPLLVAIILSATSLGIVCPVLKDAGVLDTHVGSFVVAACSIAEFGSIVVLSMFFSPTGSANPFTTALKLGVVPLVIGAIAFLTSRHGRWRTGVDEVSRCSS